MSTPLRDWRGTRWVQEALEPIPVSLPGNQTYLTNLVDHEREESARSDALQARALGSKLALLDQLLYDFAAFGLFGWELVSGTHGAVI